MMHSTVSRIILFFFEPIGILNFHWGDLFIYLIVDYICLWFLFFLWKKFWIKTQQIRNTAESDMPVILEINNMAEIQFIVKFNQELSYTDAGFHFMSSFYDMQTN